MDSEEDEAIDEDPNFYRGHDGTFIFPNGDVYEGAYIVHNTGLVWREGKGIYTTEDGHIYKGIWYNNELSDKLECEITFPNGSIYNGKLIKGQFSGAAMFTVDDGLHILCQFEDSKPVGDICFLDKKGREWHASAGDNYALLLPEHTFFSDIPARLGKGTLRIQRARQSVARDSQRSYRGGTLTMDREALNKLELKIFAKTKKTVSDLKFEDSYWYQNWIKFIKIYHNIQEKMKNYGQDGLCQEERDWMQKYEVFKQKFTKIMETRHQPRNKDLKNYKLFELFNSNDLMPPIAAFLSPHGKSGEEMKVVQHSEEHFSKSFAYQM